jgi:hypothetical protein
MKENLIRAPFNPLETPVEDLNVREYLKANIKNDVREIIRSYHQTYDHLTELLQNAVDVCENTFQMYKEGKLSGFYQPQIEIIVNLLENSVTVKDNGIGMSEDHLRKYFFMPHATLKSKYVIPTTRRRGEKGVGATFLSFGSAWINVSTKDEKGEVSSCRLEGGIEWVLREEPLDPPMAHPLNPPPELGDLSHGTIVTVGFNTNTNIKDLRHHGPDVDHWEKILRLYTAVGHVLPFGQHDDFFDALMVKVEVIDERGGNSRYIQKGFLYPHEIDGVTHERLTQLHRGREGELPLSQKNKDCIWEFYSQNQVKEKLRGKLGPSLLQALETYNPKAYIIFVWAREFWDKINRCFRTGMREFTHGLAFSTKTQRIGEMRELSFKWRTGDYNRFFVLIDVENLHADIGRKSVPSDLKRLGNEIANELHEDFVDYSDALRREPSRYEEEEAVELEQLITRVFQYPDLEGAKELDLQVIKIPHEEQDVVALFFDLLGAGYLKGYQVLATKVSWKYDSIARFLLTYDESAVYHPINNPLGIPSEKFVEGVKRSPERSLMEFKFSSDGLIRDILQEVKKLSDIRWLVCWEIGDLHKREDFEIIEITSEDQKHHREYYGTTHLLTDRRSNVHVICLKRVIEILRGLINR